MARRRGVRRRGMRLSPAPRLSVGGRLRLRESRRAGAQGARRRDAAQLLDRPADVPGRLRLVPRPARSDPDGRRSLGHRFRGRDRGRHRRRADGRRCRRGAAPHQADPAGQRRVAAQPHSGRAGEGLRLLPVQAEQRLLAGGGDAGRAGRGVGRRQDPPAAGHASQRPAVRQAQRRRRHDLRFRPADRPRRAHPPARRRHHHRLRHRLQQRRGWQSRQAGGGGRRRLFLHRRAAHGRNAADRQRQDPVPQIRRPRPHRDAGRRRPQRVRRDRAGSDAVSDRTRYSIRHPGRAQRDPGPMRPISVAAILHGSRLCAACAAWPG